MLKRLLRKASNLIWFAVEALAVAFLIGVLVAGAGLVVGWIVFVETPFRWMRAQLGLGVRTA